MSSGVAILAAFCGGLLPALLWLWFFLREDAEHPEPKWLIVAAFLSGMVAVLVALPTEMLIKCYAVGAWPPEPWSTPFATLSYCSHIRDANPILLWAAAEELIKYFLAATVILWRQAVDEPIDAMVYLLSVALGFAALETGLFLMEPLGRGDITGGFITGDLRFIGAALIHVLSSTVIGFSIALTYYRSYLLQLLSLCTGLIIAIVLHALFNHNIMVNDGAHMGFVFLSVWVGIIVVLLLFELAKHITRAQS